MSSQTLGALLHSARTAHALTLQDVAERARCSPGYVHKLEADLVHTPSPRVLAGLADALGLPYARLMAAAGYEPQSEGDRDDDGDDAARPRFPSAVKRYSNAHIVELLEQLQRDVSELRTMLEVSQKESS